MKYIILLILLTLGVWAQETAEDLAKFGGKPTFENRFLPMECEIDGVILSSDGKKLIYSTRNGKIYSQEKDKHKQIFQLTPPFLGSNLIWLDYDAGKSEKIAFVNTYKTINILDLRTNEMEKIDLNGSEFVVMVLLKQKKQLLVSASAKYSGDTAYLIDLETKKIIYESFVRTHLLYCLSIWGSAKNNIIKPLNSLLKKIWKKIGRYKQHTLNRLSTHKILKLEHELEIQESKLIWKWSKGKLPKSLGNILEEKLNNLRSRKFIIHRNSKTNSINYRLSKLASKNISEIEKATSKKTLMNSIKNRIITNNYQYTCSVRNCFICQ